MNAAKVPTDGDPRKVVVQSLALEVVGRPDVVIDLSTEGINRVNI